MIFILQKLREYKKSCANNTPTSGDAPESELDLYSAGGIPECGYIGGGAAA
jgi:hypothetical protein